MWAQTNKRATVSQAEKKRNTNYKVKCVYLRPARTSRKRDIFLVKLSRIWILNNKEWTTSVTINMFNVHSAELGTYAHPTPSFSLSVFYSANDSELSELSGSGKNFNLTIAENYIKSIFPFALWMTDLKEWNVPGPGRKYKNVCAQLFTCSRQFQITVELNASITFGRLSIGCAYDNPIETRDALEIKNQVRWMHPICWSSLIE